MKHPSATSRAVLGLALATALTGCSLIGSESDETTTGEQGSSAAESGPIVLLTHDSFQLPKRLLRDFREQTGRRIQLRASGDAGELTTKLALTAGNPDGDVAFGVDNTFASRALSEDVFAEADVALPEGAQDYSLAEGADRMFPIDSGNVCVNVDTAWFAEQGRRPPRTLDDLADPAYRGLFVTEGATTSSPGLAFLFATIAAYGEEWPAYWSRLMANDTKLTKGWEDAYFVDFTTSGGDRPIVTSYDSSPAFTVAEKSGRSTTRALLDTCFRQVEYAGVLAGSENPEGARQVVEFLLSPEVQAALPESMYVFPVRADVALPEDWARFARRPDDPATLDPQQIADNREDWLTEWTDVTTR